MQINSSNYPKNVKQNIFQSIFCSDRGLAHFLTINRNRFSGLSWHTSASSCEVLNDNAKFCNTAKAAKPNARELSLWWFWLCGLEVALWDRRGTTHGHFDCIMMAVVCLVWECLCHADCKWFLTNVSYWSVEHLFWQPARLAQECLLQGYHSQPCRWNR